MRFMLLMIPKGYEIAAAGLLPTADAVVKMMQFNAEMHRAGILLSLEGLHPPAMGARVRFDGGTPSVTDGPFPEARDVLGGFWLIDVASRAEAIDWAMRCPASANEMIEVRQVMEMTEMPPEVQAAGAEFTDLHAPPGGA